MKKALVLLAMVGLLAGCGPKAENLHMDRSAMLAGDGNLIIKKK